MKLGNRVTVLPLPANHPLKRCEGKRGEVVQMGSNGPIPQSDESLVLVDDQIKEGVPVGCCTMREWFKEEELEVG